MGKIQFSGRTSHKGEWKTYLILSFIVFVFAFGLRCLDYPKWQNPAFLANGEYILGTHDAYFWLAGARGIGSAVHNPMAILVKTLGDLTGAPLGNIAFWLPAIFSGFAAVAVFGWGILVGGPWAGLAAGVISTAIPALYFRTRLSYYDTDLVTLLFPLIVSLLMAKWLLVTSKSGWLNEEPDEYADPGLFDYLLPVFAGALTLNGSLWHGDVLTFGIVIVCIGGFLALVCSRRGKSKVAIRGIMIFALASFWGIGGLLVAIAAAFLFASEKAAGLHKADSVFTYLAVTVMLVAFSYAGSSLVAVALDKLVAYTKPVADMAKVGSGPVYPGIAQSVIEAQNVDISNFFSNIVGSEALGWLGFAGFILSLFFVPNTLFLLPFALATLAAVVMGGRFGMFGGVPVGIGLAFLATSGFKRLFANFEHKETTAVVLGVLVPLIFILNNFQLYKNMPVTPIMFKQHAEALTEAAKVMPEGSTIWTWWDWGYASMYYARQNSFANGGNHAGPVLYPLALPFATPSVAQASNFIKYSASKGNNPADAWKGKTADEVLDLLKSLSTGKKAFDVKNKQYLVVTWKDISLSYWILYYGAWNVKTGRSDHPNFARINEPFSLDSVNGVMMKKNGQKYGLSSYSIAGKGQVKSRFFPEQIGPNLIFNSDLSDGYLVGNLANSSMMVRLMFVNPSSEGVRDYFRLVYEGAPFVRIYEVL